MPPVCEKVPRFNPINTADRALCALDGFTNLERFI